MARVVASTEDYWTFIRGQLLAAPPSEAALMDGANRNDHPDLAVDDPDNAEEYSRLN